MQENRINFITNEKKTQTTFWSGVLALLYCLQKPNFKFQLILMMEMTLLKSPAPKRVFVVQWSSLELVQTAHEAMCNC